MAFQFDLKSVTRSRPGSVALKADLLGNSLVMNSCSKLLLNKYFPPFIPSSSLLENMVCDGHLLICSAPATTAEKDRGFVAKQCEKFASSALSQS